MLFPITYRPIVCVSCKTDIQLFVKERNKMEKILKLEAERKDTVFRLNYNAEQRREFPRSLSLHGANIKQRLIRLSRKLKAVT